MKYIDADKLKVKIKGLQCEQGFDTGEAERAYQSAIKDILTFIDSLRQEQMEVDLGKFDKDVTKIWGRCAAEPNDSIACLHIETFNEVARHFYELGLNTRKGN